MKTISMVDFRLKSEAVVTDLRRGESLLLTYRGRPLANLVPVAPTNMIRSDDAFYRFHEHADSQLTALTNEEIDRIVYGKP